jgi:hypothetical protein
MPLCKGLEARAVLEHAYTIVISDSYDLLDPQMTNLRFSRSINIQYEIRVVIFYRNQAFLDTAK